ncbi:hypothetical protein Ciccas_009833 [Cichlidogyrus casuarinus]|uniref:Ammonium transporter AmtB-like domain-containing protein n=1 Tax=Cichlidogyrus casuarinus TaxID=1844966 RepID=A0ABD2Q0E6_9PLAT
MLILGGCQNIQRMSKDISFELCAMLIVIVIGMYVLNSGVSSSYYISYFTTNVLLISAAIFAFNFFFGQGDRQIAPFVGNISMIYQLITCRQAPNIDNSYLTFQSPGSLMVAAINVIGICSTVFLDQSYWSASVAAKPKEGVIGFIGAGFVWFATPFVIANTFSLFYLSFGSLYGKDLLTPLDIDHGLAPQIVAGIMLGQKGKILLTTMMMVAILTTASAEARGIGLIFGAITGTVAGITSMLVYASSFEKGLTSFFENTGRVEVMLAGNCVSTGLGAILPVVLSPIIEFFEKLCLNNPFENADESDEQNPLMGKIDSWDKTRDIDDPLRPWSEILQGFVSVL